MNGWHMQLMRCAVQALAPQWRRLKPRLVWPWLARPSREDRLLELPRSCCWPRLSCSLTPAVEEAAESVVDDEGNTDVEEVVGRNDIIGAIGGG